MKKHAKAVIMLGVAGSIGVVTGIKANSKTVVPMVQPVIGKIVSVDLKKDVLYIDTSRKAILKKICVSPQFSITGLIKRSMETGYRDGVHPQAGDLLIATINPDNGNKNVVTTFTIVPLHMN